MPTVLAPSATSGSATGATYTLGVADVGHTIDVVASYTDGGGTLESVASNPPAVVTHVDHLPTGTVTISGTAAQDQVLTASNTLADTDGLGAISYQWQHDGGNVTGATGGTYTLGVADVGHSIDVVASYTDGGGTLESVASNPTAVVSHVDHPPVINQGPQTAAVADGGEVYAAGQLTATDPDAGDSVTWTIDGGTRVASESYQYAIDEFSVAKTISGTLTPIFDDTFTGTAPPGGPNFIVPPTAPNGAYAVSGGTFVAGSGVAQIDGSNAGFLGVSLSPSTY